MNKRQVDGSTVVGVVIAVSGVIAGLMLEGGSLAQVLQPTAALIVMGGTLGAVLIQFPAETVRESIRQIRHAVVKPVANYAGHIDELVGICLRARRHGMLALDPKLAEIEDSFLRKALTFAVDGVASRELREMMEIDLAIFEEREEGIVKVLEAAGGFAPTLGIIGAVMGLIQVMQKMDNVGEIGKGIAVAFVSTLYGIGLANLCFLPLAGKLKIRMRERQMVREMRLEAVLSIVEGISVLGLKQRLQSYVAEEMDGVQPQPAEPEMAT
jgi:chemotaxis protein MotA